MTHRELPDHALQSFVARAFECEDAIDRLSIAQQILPQGAHPDYWAAAKRLGDHVLDHLAMQRRVWKDDYGYWHKAEGSTWTI